MGGMARMHRTQIYLEPELAALLDRLARRRGMSRARLIREAARRLIAQEQDGQEDPIFGIIGLGHDEATDVAERHDVYLAEAEVRRWSR
jgi:metal-responsive CopG/Arc/MetJ family transcriptional regulator